MVRLKLRVEVNYTRMEKKRKWKSWPLAMSVRHGSAAIICFEQHQMSIDIISCCVVRVTPGGHVRLKLSRKANEMRSNSNQAV